MANPAKGEVAVELGGRTRKLRVGFNEVAEIEEMLGGESLSTLIQTGKFGFRAMRATMYIGLSCYDETITLEQVGDMLGESGDFQTNMQIIKTSMELAMPALTQKKGGTDAPLGNAAGPVTT